MSKPMFPHSLLFAAFTALLAGCFNAINIKPPTDTTHVKVEDSKGNVLYDGKGGDIRLREETIRKLPTDEVTITTTRSTAKEGQVVNETTTQTVKIDVGDIAGRGETETIKWDAAAGTYVTHETSVGGPSNMTQIDAPSIAFAEQAPSRKPNHVKIQNGAGEVLTDSDVGETGGLSANFDRSKFDGKLVITTKWDHGKDTVQTLTQEKGKPVDIGWDGQRYYLRPVDWRGNATHITITDAKGNTFYDGDPHNADEPYSIGNASGDKLFITTHWQHGDPTREEITKPSTLEGPPSSVTWDKSAGGYIMSALPGFMEKTESSGTVPVEGAAGQAAYAAAIPGAPAIRLAAQADNPPVSVALFRGTNTDTTPYRVYSVRTDLLGGYEVEPGPAPILIRTTFKNGDVTTQQLEYGEDDIDWDDWSGDEWVPFWWNPQTRRYELGYPPHHFVRYAGETTPKLFGDVRLSGTSVAIGASRADIPGARIGVYPTPGDPTVLKGPTHISGTSLDLGFNQLKDGKPGSRWNIGLAWGDGRKSTEVDPADPAGWLYWDQPSGSSQGLAGAGGWDATIKTSFSNYYVNWWNPRQIRSGPRYKLNFGPTARFDYTKVETNGSLEYQALPGIYTRNDVETKEYSLFAGVKLDGTYRLGGNWLGSAGVAVGLDFTSAKLDATQENSCGGYCTDSTVHIKDDWNKLGWGTTFNGSLTYSINRNSAASLLVDYRYKNNSPAVKYKIGEADNATHLGVDSREEWRVMAQYRHIY